MASLIKVTTLIFKDLVWISPTTNSIEKIPYININSRMDAVSCLC